LVERDGRCVWIKCADLGYRSGGCIGWGLNIKPSGIELGRKIDVVMIHTVYISRGFTLKVSSKDWAFSREIECGGRYPKGRKAEDGPDYIGLVH